MELLIAGILLYPFFLFAMPKSKMYWVAFAGILFISLTSSIVCVAALLQGKAILFSLPVMGLLHPLIVVDSLSAFFILTLNFTFLTGILYAKGYLSSYTETKNKTELSLHYFSFLWLEISMILVCMFHEGFAFLLAWELMTISSFFLVMFESNQAGTVRAAIHYLIQMHVGMLLILTGFLVVGKATGNMSFDALLGYFCDHKPFPVFLLFFSGFAIKAGFVPFHTWLPEAHPAAPSHVSGVMSGVMIKMGIYGIFRIIFSLQGDLLPVGIFLLVISVLTGLYGVMQAILQHDLKKLLAYHSIENIGIIGIGAGVGIIGMNLQNPALMILGFSGALLHVLNHSLFKSLLFYTAGSVYKATHTRNIEELGGLMKKMPKTGTLFLLGALSICGLPPFNGFISEFLIYSGLFNGLHGISVYLTVIFLGGIVGLALIGGLAIFCFTKAFGLTFLGSPRSEKASNASEVTTSMIFPNVIIGIVMIVIGLFPIIFVAPIIHIVISSLPAEIYDSLSMHLLSDLQQISLVSGCFILLVLALLWYRYRLMQKRKIHRGPTWGCGYTGLTPAHQYTSTSFASDYAQLVRPVIKSTYVIVPFREEEIFPENRSFAMHSSDPIQSKVVNALSEKMLGVLRRFAVLQTGKMQHYILYALVFMLFIFLLSFLNLI